MSDRRKDVSDALTEVRTVLSRARSARSRIEWVRTRATEGDDWERSHYTVDPDTDEMLAALQTVMETLERWQRG